MKDTTSAFTRDRAIRAARLVCVFCMHPLHARDFEVAGDNIRVVCPNCGKELISVEGRAG